MEKATLLPLFILVHRSEGFERIVSFSAPCGGGFEDNHAGRRRSLACLFPESWASGAPCVPACLCEGRGGKGDQRRRNARPSARLPAAGLLRSVQLMAVPARAGSATPRGPEPKMCRQSRGSGCSSSGARKRDGDRQCRPSLVASLLS